MALSDIPRKTLRSDIRSRLSKMSTEEFSDAELNHWLNMAQFDVFVRLSSISDIWYGSTQTVSISATAGSVTATTLTGAYSPDKIAKLIKVVNASGDLVPFVGDSEIHSLKNNSNFDNSYAVNWFGEKLYVFVGSSLASLSTSSHTVYFIRKPDEMTSDTNSYTITFTAADPGDGKYFRIWLGKYYVNVYARTTLGTNDDGIAFVSGAVAATNATNLNAALNHAFPSGSGLTVTVDTAVVTIVGATSVENVDFAANTTFAASTTALSYLDVPTEYSDLVILSALSKALFKLNMLGEKNQVDTDISNRFGDIRALYANEIQMNQVEKMPGPQTPRNR